jgi:hypothetical protein
MILVRQEAAGQERLFLACWGWGGWDSNPRQVPSRLTLRRLADTNKDNLQRQVGLAFRG